MDFASVIDMPGVRIDDLVGFADWVELVGLVEKNGTVSQSQIADMLLTSGLIGLEPQELFPGDHGAVEEGDFSTDDPAYRFVEDVWNHLAKRQRLLGDDYPFHIKSDLVVRVPNAWTDVPSFTQILLTAHTARYDQGVVVEQWDGTSFRELFEKVVQAAALGLFGGPSSRFGVPREPEWPPGLNERVGRFAEELDLTVLRRDLPEGPGDRGLDVAVRANVGGVPDGYLVLLTQCATGRNWKRKRGEPPLAEWLDVLKWDAKIVRSVAVPWWFESSREYVRFYRYFDEAVMLDRRRLLSGRPDKFLDQDARDKIDSLVKSLCRSN